MANIQDVNAEIDRIGAAKAAIIAAIEGKGVTVPEGALIQDLPQLIQQIATMDPNDYYTKEELAAMSELWTFQMTNGAQYTKRVIVLPNE